MENHFLIHFGKKIEFLCENEEFAKGASIPLKDFKSEGTCDIVQTWELEGRETNFSQQSKSMEKKEC